MKCDVCGGDILEVKVVGDDPLCNECYRKIHILKCDLCGGVVLENKAVGDETLCNECYLKVNNLFELKFKTILFATISIILSVIGIFFNTKALKVFDPRERNEDFNLLLVLAVDYFIAGVLIIVIFKLCNNHIKYPYIISLMVTGCLGGITLVNMNANMPDSISLEGGIVYMMFSFFIIISSIVMGILIGRCVQHFDRSI